MLTYLLANWKQLVGVAVAAAVLGWLAHRPPQPAVKLQEQEHTQETTQAATDQTVQAGPVKTTVLEFGPMNMREPILPDPTLTPHSAGGVLPSDGESVGAPAGHARNDDLPAHGPLLKATVTEQGPTTTETHSDTRATASDSRSIDLTVTPQARAGWALQVGLEDVLHGGQVRVAARRRLLGPFWAEVAALPRTRAVGVSLAVEW